MIDSPCWNFLHMLTLLVCRGGTESTRHAVQLINALIQDPAKELEDLIPRNHIRPPGANTKISSTYTTSTGATSTTAACSKGLPSVVPTSSMSFQSSTNFTAQQAGKLGRSMGSGVRPPFVSLPPLAYAHPQLALLAAQTMNQIRHPRLPMAQFGGTFSPSPNTWGPFPVRPVSPGSANSSPKHSGISAPRPGSSTLAHTEYPAASMSSTSTPTASTISPTSTAPANTPTPSSVRKQLFSTEPKSGAGVTVASTVNNSGKVAQSPISCTPTTPTTPPPPSAPIAPQPQHPPPPKPEPASLGTPAKEKPVTELTTPAAGVPSDGPNPTALLHFTSSPSGPSMLPVQPESRQPLQSHFPSSTEPSSSSSSQPGTSHPVTRLPPPTCSSTVTNTSSALPHYASPNAHGVSPRMQPPASYYPMAPGALPEQQSVFVPPGASQEPLKHQQQQPQPSLAPTGMPPHSLSMSSTMGMINGSLHLHSGKAHMPPNFGPAAIFNHFSSIFDSNQVGNNQVWGACHLPARTPPEQSYSVPTNAYISGIGQIESVIPPPDGSKAPGYRFSSQRIVSSPIGECNLYIKGVQSCSWMATFLGIILHQHTCLEISNSKTLISWFRCV